MIIGSGQQSFSKAFVKKAIFHDQINLLTKMIFLIRSIITIEESMNSISIIEIANIPSVHHKSVEQGFKS